MKPLALIAAIIGSATMLIGLVANAAMAMPLETLPHGRYICALPGNAGGPAWLKIEGKDIEIRNASSYRAHGKSGIYLKIGPKILFTRGPMKGEQYEQIGPRTLRKLKPDGSKSNIYCLRGVILE